MHSPDRFFASGALDRATALRTLEDALHGADDGELYLEYRASEAYVFDDGRLKTASGDTSQGFGLRAVKGETTGYAHSAEMTDEALKRAAATVKAVANRTRSMLRAKRGDQRAYPGLWCQPPALYQRQPTGSRGLRRETGAAGRD